MTVFALPGFEYLAPRQPRAAVGTCSVARFANGELHATIEGPVEGRHCVVVGSAAPPDERLLALTLVAHTLASHGAAGIRAVLPYLGYARQDELEPGRSLGAAWVGELLRASGIEDVVTVDLHSTGAARLLPMPVTSLPSASVFAPEVAKLGTDELTVVAPDEGAVERCEALRVLLGVSRPVAWLAKRRTREGVAHLGVNGSLSRRAIVVDDILDTGGTLVSCCRVLADEGVKETTIAVSHGLFTGDGWQEVWDAGATRLLITDTVPGRAPYDPRISVLSVRPLLERWMAGVDPG
jgi:ribose-phosphate pyrophosphokinase